jgi:hypothetical protein
VTKKYVPGNISRREVKFGIPVRKQKWRKIYIDAINDTKEMIIADKNIFPENKKELRRKTIGNSGKNAC